MNNIPTIGQGPKGPSISINLERDSTPILCECGSPNFKEVMTFRRISKLLIGEQEDKLMAIPSIICIKCSKRNDEVSPKLAP